MNQLGATAETAEIRMIRRFAASTDGVSALARLLQLDADAASVAEFQRFFCRLGSLVTCEDCATGEIFRVEIATPERVMETRDRISIASPLGCVLIARPAGAISSWVDERNRLREFVIVEVISPVKDGRN